MFSRWKLALETSANFVATHAGNSRIPAWVSGKCVMGISTHNFLLSIFFSRLLGSARVHSIPVDLSFCARSVVAWAMHPATYRKPLSCSSVYLSYYNASIPRWFMRLLVQAMMNHAGICLYH